MTVPAPGLAELVGLDPDRLRVLLGRLTAHGLTVAAAESLTGGLLTAVLTEVPGSSAVVRGALVVYATPLKHTLAGVDDALLAARGPVDPEVAVALARGAAERCGADLGIGLTGVAGPDPQGGAAVGAFHVALCLPPESPGAPRAARLHSQAADPDARVPGRSEVRAAAVRAAVALLEGIVPAGSE